MKQSLNRISRKLLALSAVFAAVLVISVSLATAPESQTLEPSARHRLTVQTITQLFEERHYRQANINNELSSKIFDNYLEGLDPNRQYLLAEDVRSFEQYRYDLDETVRHGDLDLVFEIFQILSERTVERMEFAITQLEHEPDFTLDETFVFARSDAPWAEGVDELDDWWGKRVKNDVLSLLLADRTLEDARDVLSKRYGQVIKRVDQINSDDVFETFMNAYAHTLDPHSTYFSPRNSEEYRIQMSLSYEGIGASLQLTDDFVTVQNIIPGGPAAASGKPEINDRITAVGQDIDGELVDVVGWRLDDVVQLIRGPGGSIVRLQILPAGAAPGSEEHVIHLVRDKIKLEAQAAQKNTVTVDRGEDSLTIGVIDVPSFYQDYVARSNGAKDYTSTTSDVRRLVAELLDEDMDGLVIDLRGNGGGHLDEATRLTRLFVDDGPVVQLRSREGRKERIRTFGGGREPEVVYGGPLVVLVNRYSASASEIFAAAIQDYDRGIIVGQRTYGKGSVQHLYPLRATPDNRRGEWGQITLTSGKYYRVTGESTQHRGVRPDIELPSVVDVEEIGESTRDSALPWDTIDPARFVADNPLDAAIDSLVEMHTERTAQSADYGYLLSDIEAYREVRSRQNVSLNLESRREERDAARQQQLERENNRRAAHGLPPVASLDELEEQDLPDVVLQEAAEIVGDMVDITVPAPGQTVSLQR